jgi:sulfonate transport system substrate-binding protein
MNSGFNKKRRQTLHRISAITLGAVSSSLPMLALAADQSEHSVSQSIQPGVLHIGFQKYGTLALLKGTGSLEKRLATSGVQVKWSEFPAGPQLLEGLNVGSIDIGMTGESPPIFAQAAGTDLLYIGNEPPGPASEAILIPANSTIKSVSELRGKKIALNKGANVHYLLVKALEKAGVAYRDVQTVFLPPADARAAFERGSVDAWAIWDPFFAAAQVQLKARILVDGTGLVSNHQFYLASRSYAQKNQRIVQIVVEELNVVGSWANSNTNEVAAILARQTGLEKPILDLSARRFAFGAIPLPPAVVREQQVIADTFFDLKLIPKKISIAEVVYNPNTALIGSTHQRNSNEL